LTIVAFTVASEVVNTAAFDGSEDSVAEMLSTAVFSASFVSAMVNLTGAIAL